jgi:hypothetical protein
MQKAVFKGDIPPPPNSDEAADMYEATVKVKKPANILIL